MTAVSSEYVIGELAYALGQADAWTKQAERMKATLDNLLQRLEEEEEDESSETD